MGERHTTMYCHNCNKQTSASQPTANHILHLLITLLACGFWLPVWILCALFPGPKRCATCGLTAASGRLIGRAIKGVAVVMGLFFVAAAFMTYSKTQTPRAPGPVTAAMLPVEPQPTAPASMPDEPAAPAVEEKPDAPPATKPQAEPARADPAEPETDAARMWTSADGKFKVEATFLSKTGDKVKLKKADGKIVTITVAKLSDKDQEWIKERAAHGR